MRILIVSPHFPPVNAPDMQRIRVALPYFVEAGCEVTVLTVDDPTPTAPVDPELLETIPPGVRIERAHCWSRRWTDWLGVNNVALRSLPFLFLAGRRLLRNRRHDVVYFSTTMFITLAMGRVWKFLTGVPYVIDLQDPWVTDYYQRTGTRPPGGWKYRVSHALGLALEGWSLRRVAHLIVVSEAYVETLRRRHPFLRATPATELPFGSPDPDLARLRTSLTRRPSLLPQGGLRLAMAGALGPGQLASVDVLFGGVALARKRGMDVFVHFFGTSYAHGTAAPLTRDLAERHGLRDSVREQPSRLRYFDAMRLTLEADVNLLLGSTDLDFTPSKILGLMAAGRPLLAVAPEGSAMINRLRSLGLDCISFRTGGPDSRAFEQLAELLAVLAGTHRPTPPPVPPAYTAGAVATRQMEILSSVA